MKALVWMGSSRHDVKAFPDEARREAGFQLDRLQQGLDPEDWKPMTSIGSGVREIRIRDESGAYRVIYVVKVRSTIHVLHGFKKTSQKTTLHDLRLAQERFKQIGD